MKFLTIYEWIYHLRNQQILLTKMYTHQNPTWTQIVAICAWFMLSKNDICVCGAKQHLFKNTEQIVFSIFDVYPRKFDRMKLLVTPTETSHPGASFGAMFGLESLLKWRVVHEIQKKNKNSIFNFHHSFCDRISIKSGPTFSYGPCASFMF